jgi:hypothetical protein
VLVGANIVLFLTSILPFLDLNDSDYDLVNQVGCIVDRVARGSPTNGRQLGDAYPLAVFVRIEDVDVVENLPVCVRTLDNPQGNLDVLTVPSLGRLQLAILDQARILSGRQDFVVFGWLDGIGVKWGSAEQGSDITRTIRHFSGPL